MTTYLITGANRGVGWAMVQQLAAAGDTVFAACRTPASAESLQALATANPNIHVVQLDVTNEATIESAAKAVSAETNAIDVLINNAGILIRDKELAQVSAEDIQHTMAVNVTGPMLVAKHFASLLKNGTDPKLINISSQLGSVLSLQDKTWGSYSYNASKGAINIMGRMLSHELKPDGVCVLTMHPGWVQTDMGGSEAAVTPFDSAEGILKVIHSATMADTNKFYIYNGEEHIW